jgi:hypothetical protein
LNGPRATESTTIGRIRLSIRTPSTTIQNAVGRGRPPRCHRRPAQAASPDAQASADLHTLGRWAPQPPA